MYFLKGMVIMKEFLNGISLLPDVYKNILTQINPDSAKDVKEIRFRNGGAVTLIGKDNIYYLTDSGKLTLTYCDNVLKTDERKLQEIVFSISRRSLHTYQDMIAKGYIPLRGGCKAGVAGRAVIKNGAVYSVSSFNSVNIRIAREFYGCSQSVIDAVQGCRSYIIIGPPLSGKTTLLRDLCRYYSGKNSPSPFKTAVIDERDEIASLSFGFGLDVGEHTDVLALYPKAVGTEIAVRTLSPDIIVLDEIGSAAEAEALLSAVNTGVDFIATAHGSEFEEVLKRPNIKRLIDAGVFKKAVILEGKTNPTKVKGTVTF